ncbi:MAG: hypothetical protein ABFS28_03340 [Bacteroidota bacterium]
MKKNLPLALLLLSCSMIFAQNTELKLAEGLSEVHVFLDQFAVRDPSGVRKSDYLNKYTSLIMAILVQNDK